MFRSYEQRKRVRALLWELVGMADVAIANSGGPQRELAKRQWEALNRRYVQTFR